MLCQSQAGHIAGPWPTRSSEAGCSACTHGQRQIRAGAQHSTVGGAGERTGMPAPSAACLAGACPMPALITCSAPRREDLRWLSPLTCRILHLYRARLSSRRDPKERRWLTLPKNTSSTCSIGTLAVLPLARQRRLMVRGHRDLLRVALLDSVHGGSHDLPVAIVPPGSGGGLAGGGRRTQLRSRCSASRAAGRSASSARHPGCAAHRR